MSIRELPYLDLPSRPDLPPIQFVWHVVRARYRNWILALFFGEAAGATCGILLPSALSRIITTVTRGKGDPRAILESLHLPLATFAALCLGELVERSERRLVREIILAGFHHHGGVVLGHAAIAGRVVD